MRHPIKTFLNLQSAAILPELQTDTFFRLFLHLHNSSQAVIISRFIDISTISYLFSPCKEICANTSSYLLVK